MTFASYFSYLFSGGSSYENQLVLSDLTSSNKLGEVFGTLKKIILVTFTLEAIGAFLIFFTLDSKEVYSYLDKGFFAIFHSISAFCNAGFSTLENSLFEAGFRFNYSLQSIILLLFVIGGLGFPIVFNLFNYLKYLIKNRLIPAFSGSEIHQTVTPWVVNLNTRIVLITTTLLLLIGSGVFFVFEYNNTLAEHNLFGKIITSIFSAATPRTAGFNSVDTSALNFYTIMLIFLLMLIGASPASTGGGIKTSTFAIATLNFWSLARGKERIELYRREVANISVMRAFAIISLSLVAIGLGVFAIAYFDNEKELIDVAFECFSAYSTVGLSLGITDSLSDPSKFVLICLMFTGRVSMLSLLIAITQKEKRKHYRYSKDEILIN
jgi:Trk-type K+ transport system membrane component